MTQQTPEQEPVTPDDFAAMLELLLPLADGTELFVLTAAWMVCRSHPDKAPAPETVFRYSPEQVHIYRSLQEMVETAREAGLDDLHMALRTTTTLWMVAVLFADASTVQRAQAQDTGTKLGAPLPATNPVEQHWLGQKTG